MYLYEKHQHGGSWFAVSIVITTSDSPRLVCPGRLPSWRTGEWNSCSVTCGGGSQVRTVECISHDSAGLRVVEDAVCAAYAEAPPSLQTCNMHACPEFRVAGWSAVSYEMSTSARWKRGVDVRLCACSAQSRVDQVSRPERSPVLTQEAGKETSCPAPIVCVHILSSAVKWRPVPHS